MKTVSSFDPDEDSSQEYIRRGRESWQKRHEEAEAARKWLAQREAAPVVNKHVALDVAFLESKADERTVMRGRNRAKGYFQFCEFSEVAEHTASISSLVTGTTANAVYETSIEFDPQTGKIEGYFCDCPASMTYPGPCKHVIGLGNYFMREPQRFNGYADYALPPRTTPILQMYMQEHTNMRRTAHIAAESVILEPTVSSPFSGGWELTLRIARLGANRKPEKFYVVKQISELLRAVRRREVLSFGKQLTVALAPDVFEPRSRQLWELLARLADSRATGYGNLPPTIGKEMLLSQSEILDLLEVYDGASLRFSLGKASKASGVPVRREDPELAGLVRVREEADGRLVLVSEQRMQVFTSGQRMALFYNDAFYLASPELAEQSELLRLLFEGNYAKFTVAAEDVPTFCATLLPQLEDVLGLEAPQKLHEMRPVPGKLEFYFDRDDYGITAKAAAVYGKRSYSVRDQREDVASRDLPLEDIACELLDTYLGPGDAIPASDTEATGILVYTALPAFAAAGEVFTTPDFDRLKRGSSSSPQVGLSLQGHLINLHVTSGDFTQQELAAILNSYVKKKHYHRLPSGAVVNLDTMDLSQAAHMMEDLDVSALELTSGTAKVDAYRALYLEQTLDGASFDDAFMAYVERAHTLTTSEYAPPATLDNVLRPYQRDGFNWLNAVCDLDFGGILADEMGLGKSLQLISFLLARREEASQCGPSLIVCPASLVYNWVAEFERFAPELNVVPVEGVKRTRSNTWCDAFFGRPRVRGGAALEQGLEQGLDEKRAAAREAAREAALAQAQALAPGERPEVLIASYDAVRMDVDLLHGCEFYTVVLDEAQYIKNHATKTAHAVKALAARHRYALTGTPVENRLSEVWSIFDFLMPGFFGSYNKFRVRFEADIMGGDEEAAARLAALIGPFVLRRKKADVLKDLPEKLEQTVLVPLTGKQRELYQAREQLLRQMIGAKKGDEVRAMPAHPARPGESHIEILAELTRLRQIALDPSLLYENVKQRAAKLDVIIELVREANESGQKVLVFSQFTSYLELLGSELTAAGINYVTITGATPKRRRLELVDLFNACSIDDAGAFLISLKAGGTGLNLTGASVVIHADPWWNAAATNQATDRAHRIGQHREVTVYKVIAKDTIEERIVKLQEAKLDLAESVLGASDGMSLASLTSDELLSLLGE
jgi:superfamily II DNA or RNA helicase